MFWVAIMGKENDAISWNDQRPGIIFRKEFRKKNWNSSGCILRLASQGIREAGVENASQPHLDNGSDAESIDPIRMSNQELQSAGWGTESKGLQTQMPSWLAGSRSQICGACGTGIQKAGRHLSCRSLVLLGLWDWVLIPEMWDCLITSRLVEAATGLEIDPQARIG